LYYHSIWEVYERQNVSTVFINEALIFAMKIILFVLIPQMSSMNMDYFFLSTKDLLIWALIWFLCGSWSYVSSSLGFDLQVSLSQTLWSNPLCCALIFILMLWSWHALYERWKYDYIQPIILKLGLGLCNIHHIRFKQCLSFCYEFSSHTPQTVDVFQA